MLTAINADDEGRFFVGDATAAWIGSPMHETRFVADFDPTIDLGAAVVQPAPGSVLRFDPPATLACPDDPLRPIKDTAFLLTCGGFGEPQVEVGGNGWVWASAVCCIGRSPPVWYSTDGGRNFDHVAMYEDTGVVRDAWGVEGDLAIDDAGNVYLFDLAVGGTFISSWDHQANHRFTAPYPVEAPVDRPWIHGGAADEVFILYNDGSRTNFYRSEDGGRTFPDDTFVEFPCYLMTFGQGPTRDRMFVTGCNGAPVVYETTDGGRTWNDPVRLPFPDWPSGVPRQVDTYMPPASDDAGNIYIPFRHNVDNATENNAVFVNILHTNGTTSGPHRVSEVGRIDKPWLVAGAEGRVTVAYFAADASRSTEESASWYVHAATSLDAHTGKPSWQRTKVQAAPVLEGVFDRQLGDFLQADIGPNGKVWVTYGHREDGVTVNRVVSTDGGLDLGPESFLNG